MIIGELIHSRLPFCYSKLHEREIVEEWNLKDNFNYGMNTRKRYGIQSIENIMKIVSMVLMRFKYRERFCLEGVL